MPKECLACGQIFQARPQSPHQEYCSNAVCQKERKRRWQLIKRKIDPDYKDNQQRAQQAWVDAHPNYWKEYRESHPAYTENNRSKQRGRSQQSIGDPIAKMDVSTKALSPQTGLYLLIEESSNDVSKKDAWLVRLTLISAFKVEQNS